MKRIAKKGFIGVFALSSVLLNGCADDDLPKYVELGGLRVLAIKVDNGSGYAEVSPGDAVTLTPYVSDYQGGTRTLSYEAKACVDSGVAVGVEPSCEGVTGAVSVASGAVTITGTERTGSGTTFSVTVPSTLLDSRSAVDQYNGVNYLVTYKLTASDGATVQSFKRIPVSSAGKTTKNQNPSLTGISTESGALTAMPSGDAQVRATYSGSSIENYDVKKSDLSLESKTEELLVTWFITDGSLQTYRSLNDASVKYTPPTSAPTDHTAIIVGVMRDGRGGVSFFLQNL